jgi:hypothetical protein
MNNREIGEEMGRSREWVRRQMVGMRERVASLLCAWY